MTTKITSKALIFTLALSVFFSIVPIHQADALVHVNGYYRKDGTYVRPHYRTDPDGITSNNFSANGISTVDMSESEAAAEEARLKGGTSAVTPPSKPYLYTAISNEKNNYHLNPDGFREQLVSRLVTEYPEKSLNDIGYWVYVLLPDIKTK